MTSYARCKYLVTTERSRYVCSNDHICDMPCKAKDRSLVTPANRDDFVVWGKPKKGFKRL